MLFPISQGVFQSTC
ncbi:hypothetical protein ID866_9582 [Astraeus odoratus]|nr:hypothetical protein ID866_9582 [Astraeus odoratus]